MNFAFNDVDAHDSTIEVNITTTNGQVQYFHLLPALPSSAPTLTRDHSPSLPTTSGNHNAWYLECLHRVALGGKGFNITLSPLDLAVPQSQAPPMTQSTGRCF